MLNISILSQLIDLIDDKNWKIKERVFFSRVYDVKMILFPSIKSIIPIKLNVYPIMFIIFKIEVDL